MKALREAIDRQEPRPAGPKNLRGGLHVFYPKLDSQELKRWESRLQEESVEPELVLFTALLCGAHFWLWPKELRKTLEDLHFWLTSHPRLMPEELAEIILEALEPGLRRGVNRPGGWEEGLEGRPLRVVNAPEYNRAAWVSALLIKNHFARAGLAKGKSTELALSLPRALLGRKDEVDDGELSRAHGTMGKPDPEELMKELTGQYEYWILEDILLEDTLEEEALPKDVPIEGPPKHPKKYAWPDQKGDDYQEQRPKHKELPFLLDRFGSTTFARKALYRIARGSWLPFDRDHPGV